LRCRSIPLSAVLSQVQALEEYFRSMGQAQLWQHHVEARGSRHHGAGSAVVDNERQVKS